MHDGITESAEVMVMTPSNFNDTINKSKNKVLVIDAFATWCGPCQEVWNILIRRKRMGDGYIVAKADVDQLDRELAPYNIASIQLFWFLRMVKR